jgi:Mrp family chromosome partitioning ATPase
MSAPAPSSSGANAAASTALPGRVVTFYSYKGGVGRSMALANVAALLSQAGRRVLVVDWDLEAPGLERYFAPWLRGSRTSSVGVVDLVAAYAAGSPIDWRLGLLEATPFGQPPVRILTAGRADERYPERLQALNWEQLFAERNFGDYLEQLRTEWTAEHELVLIDSRTGITDIGGICSVLLPDWIVAMFTANEQSLQGVVRVAEMARRMHASVPRERGRLVVVPVPSRDESRTEKEKAESWHRTFAERLAGEYDWLPRGVAPLEAVKQLKLPHIPFWNFGEELPVKHEHQGERDTLSAAYGALSRLLGSQLDWSEVVQGATNVGAAFARAEEAVARADAAAKDAAVARTAYRRSRRWVGFAAVAALLAVGGLLMAYRAQRRTQQVAALLAEADQTLAKSPDAALPIYTRAVDLDPSNALAHYRRGLALLAANDAVRAEIDFTAAIDGAYASGEQQDLLAEMYAARARSRERREPAKALEDYELVLKLVGTDPAGRPKRAATWARIGAVRQALGEHGGKDGRTELTEALRAYTESMREDPQASDVRFSRGVVKELLGDRGGAQEDFATVVQSPSTDPDVAEAARSRLRRLGTSVSAGGQVTEERDQRPVVYVQYAAKEDGDAVRAVVEGLKQKGALLTFSPDPELVVEARGNDVRYFYPQDEKTAYQVKTLVEGEFARQGTPVRLAVRFVEPSKLPRARPGHLEVWLPPLRLPLIQSAK